jgi:hypothetical protein
MIHEKKILQIYFEKILNNEKTFEIRLGNEDYSPGDTIILKEITLEREYTGREIKKEITYVTNTKNCNYWPEENIEKYGLSIIGFK